MIMFAAVLAGFAQPTSNRSAADRLALYLRRTYAQHSVGDGPITFKIGWYDLNRDGRQEALVLLTGPSWCGSGGCTLVILQQKGASFAEIGNAQTYPDVEVLRTASRGYRDLIIPTNYGGGSAFMAKMRWNGRSYWFNKQGDATLVKTNVRGYHVLSRTERHL